MRSTFDSMWLDPGLLSTSGIASAMFRRARQRSTIHGLVQSLIGQSSSLAALSARPLRVRHAAGLHSVALRAIVGGENSRTDFDARFDPRSDHTRERWLSIASARLRDVDLPPIELIRIDDQYFVRDGHHRVSVTRALGQCEIDALVTVWEVDRPPVVDTETRSAPFMRSRWRRHTGAGGLPGPPRA